MHTVTKPFHEGHTRFLEEGAVIAMLNSKIEAGRERIERWQDQRHALMEEGCIKDAENLTAKIMDMKSRIGALTVARDHLKFCEAFEFIKTEAKGGITCLTTDPTIWPSTGAAE